MKTEYQLTIERIEKNEKAFFIGDKLISILAVAAAMYAMIKVFGW
jgi:phosphoglycolate phosphatase-like HAD superfamily hydrolase